MICGFSNYVIMKKTLRLVAVLMIVAMLSISLVSCAKTLNGTYKNENSFGQTITYTFEKDTYVKKTTSNVFGAEITTTEEGTYEIINDPDNDGALLIVFTTVSGDSTIETKESFVEGKEGNVRYIKIGSTQYNLVD